MPGRPPDVWYLQKVVDTVYLIYFVRGGILPVPTPTIIGHWLVPDHEPDNSRPEIPVIGEFDPIHRVNNVVGRHVTRGLDGSLEEFTRKLKEIYDTHEHDKSFWRFTAKETPGFPTRQHSG
ncbi:hypothetical protein Clacol_010192 [Clathrus columnatus]|uniref:Uncharacterized protein n=1 Tax=Clathrus columnatus TaxID=1419009 RepID=A0AAV5AMS5_9AGAM|nr:hypothetical protein Clacol_010192 [Clathrus columnatus]